MVRLIVWLLNRQNLSVKDRIVLVNSLIDKLNGIPVKDVIEDRDGILLIGGKEVDLDVARSLRESAKVALNNPALKLVQESVIYQAFAIAGTKAEKAEDLLFGKAAIWWGQTQNKILLTLSGKEEILVE